MKIVLIGGEPAVGKSTLMRSVLSMFKPEQKEFKFGLVRGTIHEFLLRKTFVLGVYDYDLFSGTDKLSMAVQPHVEEFLLSLRGEYPDCAVLMEGDRIFTRSFLHFVMENFASEAAIFLLKASKAERDRRIRLRLSKQSDRVLAARATKLQRIEQGLASESCAVNVLTHETEADTKTIRQLILNHISAIKVCPN